MPCDMSSQWNTFYSACCNNDLKKVRETVKASNIDTIGPDGDTALHAASRRGHVDVVRLLLRYHASRTIKNADGLTAEQLAKNEEVQATFNAILRTISDPNHFVASTLEVEWLDTYKNAYRISYENHEHMKRWLTKVALHKLLKEINDGYINNLNFPNEDQRNKIKQHLQYVIELEDPLGLLVAYTDPGTRFFFLLNRDLAEVGSDFRFVSTQSLINSGYLDNEAPRGLGQYIFASLIINHPRFRPYYHIGTTYRGMNITPRDLQEYNKGEKIVMTRSFLSTSIKREAAELFLGVDDYENHPPVMCIYTVINPRSNLHIQAASLIEDEEEVLIIPFTVFEVKQQREIEIIKENKPCRITEIELEERSQTQA